jgi:hypothetical protein
MEGDLGLFTELIRWPVGRRNNLEGRLGLRKNGFGRPSGSDVPEAEGTENREAFIVDLELGRIDLTQFQGLSQCGDPPLHLAR